MNAVFRAISRIGMILGILVVTAPTAIAQQQLRTTESQKAGAVEAFATGNALLDSHIEGSAVWPDVLREAVRQYNRAISLQPDFLEAHFNKGVALIRLGGNARLAEAEACFNTVLRLKPNHADALFAKGQAQFRIGVGSKASGSADWERAAQPAEQTLRTVLSRFSGSNAASNARAELNLIKWYRETDLVAQITGRSRKPQSPIQSPMRVEATREVESVTREAVTRIKTGVIADDVSEIKVAAGSKGEYLLDGKVENTSGLALHRFSLRLYPTEVRSDWSFMMLRYEFTYDGETSRRNIRLPRAEAVLEVTRMGEAPLSPIIEVGHVKVGISLLDAEASSPSTYYRRLTIRTISEIVP